MQTPPQYSAIKIDGNRAYDLARERRGGAARAAPGGHRPARACRDAGRRTSIFEAECGRGTYVRALARDMGRLLGCLGHVTQLRRMRVAAFTRRASVTIAELEAAHGLQDGGTALNAMLQPIELALSDLIEVTVSQPDAARLARGQAVLMRGRDAPDRLRGGLRHLKGTLIALCEIEKGELVPIRVFSYRA